MKLLLTVLLAVCAVQSYNIRKIDGIDKQVTQIEFDSNLNSYVRIYYPGQFYKLDDQNNISLQQNYYNLRKIIINTDDDCYLVDAPSSTGAYRLSQLKSNSSDIKYLFSYKPHTSAIYNNAYYNDKSDNFYFNTADGVIFLRTEQNIPSLIQNLEGFVFDKSCEDEENNVYLVNSQLQNNSIKVITKDSKRSPVPAGNVFPGINHKVSDFRYWRNIPFVVEHPNDTITSVNASSNHGNTLLLSQYRVNYYFVNITHNERFFIIEDSTITNASHLYLITPNLEIVNVVESLNSTILKQNGVISAVDKQGTAYFAYLYDGKHKVLRLRINETSFSEIYVPTRVADIYDLQVDDDDNLWILADELLLLEKGKDLPVTVSEAELVTDVSSFLKIKKETGEIYIAASNGLFVCSND